MVKSPRSHGILQMLPFAFMQESHQDSYIFSKGCKESLLKAFICHDCIMGGGTSQHKPDNIAVNLYQKSGELVEVGNQIPLFAGFYTSKRCLFMVVWDFFHPQYFGNMDFSLAL